MSETSSTAKGTDDSATKVHVPTKNTTLPETKPKLVQKKTSGSKDKHLVPSDSAASKNATQRQSTKQKQSPSSQQASTTASDAGSPKIEKKKKEAKTETQPEKKDKSAEAVDVSVEKKGDRSSTSDSSAKTSSSLATKVYGVLSPPTFMLNEVVNLDQTFSAFDYALVAECNNKIYGYGTLELENSVPPGDEGVIEFDPVGNDFRLLFSSDTDFQTTDTDKTERASGSTLSPGGRSRGTLVARRRRSAAAANGSAPERAASGASDASAGGVAEQIDGEWVLTLFGGQDPALGLLTNDLWDFTVPPSQASDASVSIHDTDTSKRIQNIRHPWQEVTTTGTRPAARGSHAACVSQDKRLMYICGGIDEHDKLLNDCYELSERQNWLRLSSNSPLENAATAGSRTVSAGAVKPPPRCGHTIVCGSTVKGGNILYMFGGDLSSRGSASNDLWKFNVKQKLWMCITMAAGTVPCPRFNHTSVFAENKVWIAGGIAPGWFSNTELKDLYGFDVTALFWFQCEITVATPAAAQKNRLPTRFYPAAYWPVTRSFFVFGGKDSGLSNHSSEESSCTIVYCLVPVCTMESLAPLNAAHKALRKEVDELQSSAEKTAALLTPLFARLPQLQQLLATLQQRAEELQDRSASLQNKKKEILELQQKVRTSDFAQNADGLESRLARFQNLPVRIDTTMSDIKGADDVLRLKAASDDVDFLKDALDKLSV